jgi:hypothetical protein
MLKAFDKLHEEVLSWNVSDRLGTTEIRRILATDYVVVGGNELSWVITCLVNIPHHRTEDPQIYTGDLARFIVAHLPAKDGQQ